MIGFFLLVPFAFVMLGVRNILPSATRCGVRAYVTGASFLEACSDFSALVKSSQFHASIVNV